MPFRYEYAEKLRVACIGAGPAARVALLPALAYAPVELVALADADKERGLDAARSFGARRFYPNHKALLNKEEDLDAVFVMSEPDEEGLPTGTGIAALALESGTHAWVASPPCSSADDISTFTRACLKRQKYVVAGFTKPLSTIYVKLSELIEDPTFGATTSFVMHYPLAMPSQKALGQPVGRAAFLDLVNVYPLLLSLFGEARECCLLRSEGDGVGDGVGDAVIHLRYDSGLLGTLVLSAAAPGERLQVFGVGGSAVAERGSQLTLWKPGITLPTGNEAMLAEDGMGVRERRIVWRQDLTDLRLVNHPPIRQGWVASVRRFATQLLADEAPLCGNLVEILHTMSLFDKLCRAEPGKWFTI